MTGAVLAGGRGRRMGSTDKAAVELAGRPLIEYPLQVLGEVCERVAVICKRDTVLPPLVTAAERWEEPEHPRHPAAGIAQALARAGGPVLVCAGDMPFVTAGACRALLERFDASPGVRAAIARADDRLQPVLGVYAPEAAGVLAACGDAPLTRLAESLDPAIVELPAALVRSLNTPEELAAAESELIGR